MDTESQTNTSVNVDEELLKALQQQWYWKGYEDAMKLVRQALMAMRPKEDEQNADHPARQ